MIILVDKKHNTLLQMSNFCPKNQFWHNFTFRHIWILPPKLEGILEHFILKSIKLLNFHAKNQDFDPKSDLKNVEKKLISTNFWTKTRNYWIFCNLRFKIFCQIVFKYQIQSFSKVEFLDKKWWFRTVCMNEWETLQRHWFSSY